MKQHKSHFGCSCEQFTNTNPNMEPHTKNNAHSRAASSNTILFLIPVGNF